MKLILDTSACSRIATSRRRKEIEGHLYSKFCRVMSVPTFWELLDKIDGGDGSHFDDDKEVIRVASGKTRRPLMLPNPLSYAVETVLKLPRPSGPIPPRVFKQAYELVMKARTRKELYEGPTIATAFSLNKEPSRIYRRTVLTERCPVWFMIDRSEAPAAAADVAGIYTWKRSIVRRQSHKPQQIGFDVCSIWNPHCAVLPIEVLGFFAAHER